jgi:subtilisin
VPSIIVKEPAKVAMNVKDKKDSEVKETKEVKSEEVKEAKETHEVKHEVSQHSEEASTTTGDVAVNTGSAAGGVSGWSIGLGALVLGGLAAAAGGGGGGGSSDGDSASSSDWSSVSGWGEIDVLAALSSLTETDYDNVADATDVSWGINRSDANDANYYGYTGEGVTIAIIDSGIDIDNSDINGNISEYSTCFIDGYDTTDIDDNNGHGTYIASIIGAANNGEGLTGAAYDAELMILRVSDNDGAAIVDIREAIYYAVDNGADIISISLGGDIGDSVQCMEALQYADDHGVLVVMAAGNEYYTEPTAPAVAAQEIDGALAVGAIGQSGDDIYIPSFSNDAGSSTPYGYVLAAGVDVEAYNLDGVTIDDVSGTSFSAPLVAAEAAILLSTGLIADNASTDEALVNLITSSANAVLV